MTVAAQLPRGLSHQALGAAKILNRSNKRKHQPQRAVRRGAQDGAQLAHLEIFEVKREAETTPAERRVLFLGQIDVRQAFIADHVHRAHGDDFALSLIDDLAVNAVQLVFVEAAGGHQVKFSTIEANAAEIVAVNGVHFGGFGNIGADEHLFAVGGARRQRDLILQQVFVLAVLRHQILVLLHHVFARVDEDQTLRAVDDDEITIAQHLGQIFHAHHGRNAGRPQQHSGVVAGVAHLADHAADGHAFDTGDVRQQHFA